ncbi:hypothetical protein MLD38_017423 [Melastoma candidum]|uniref:Uncharacterized protein n=1 Tax=Melastoma candidum TaxID=119954 RepID=A0ACB9QSH6_9MYRT|nr:hypothetical protein MLD38_017423 [Melastoma candidum]
MDTPTSHAGAFHIVAVPYPGRGHVNPMMNLCKILVSRSRHLLVTFVVTEEWLGIIGSDPMPDSIRFATIPNVIPSEKGRAADFPGFYEAVMTKMEDPFEQLLDGLDGVDVLLADVELLWGINIGRRRNTPVALLWTLSAMFFSVFLHFDLLEQNYRFPIDLSEHGNDCITNIPGIASVSPAELPTETDPNVLRRAVECVSLASKAQYLLFTNVYELEVPEMEALKSKFRFPVLSVGPAIPYLDLNGHHQSNPEKGHDTCSWLVRRPSDSRKVAMEWDW